MAERRFKRKVKPFSGNDAEKTYLTYFATGDLHATRHGTKVRLEGGTTHEAQMKLIQRLFSQYARPIVYPCESTPGRYSWKIVFDLDRSFEFLLDKAKSLPQLILKNDRLFFVSTNGFTVAEGHIEEN